MTTTHDTTPPAENAPTPKPSTGIHIPTVVIASCMIALGVIAYITTGTASKTPLIPSFIGLAILLCGLLAAIARKPALITALVLSVLGFLGPLGRIIPTAIKGELSFGPAIVSQVVFMVLAVALIALVIVGLRRSALRG